MTRGQQEMPAGEARRGECCRSRGRWLGQAPGPTGHTRAQSDAQRTGPFCACWGRRARPPPSPPPPPSGSTPPALVAGSACHGDGRLLATSEGGPREAVGGGDTGRGEARPGRGGGLPTVAPRPGPASTPRRWRAGPHERQARSSVCAGERCAQEDGVPRCGRRAPPQGPGRRPGPASAAAEQPTAPSQPRRSRCAVQRGPRGEKRHHDEEKGSRPGAPGSVRTARRGDAHPASGCPPDPWGARGPWSPVMAGARTHLHTSKRRHTHAHTFAHVHTRPSQAANAAHRPSRLMGSRGQWRHLHGAPHLGVGWCFPSETRRVGDWTGVAVLGTGPRPPRGAQGPVVGAAFPTCTGRGAKEQMHSRRAVTMQGEDNHRAVLCPWGGHVHCPTTSLETSWLPPEQPHCERLRPRLLGTWQVRERPPCRCHMGSLVGWGAWRMRVMGLGVMVLFPHSAMF